jgi:limonene-1,2-epoxide hydrolase
MTPAQIVNAFLQAFFSGDVETALGLTSEDFTFTAPYQISESSRERFFAGAAEKAALIRGIQILRQCESGCDVATLYRLEVACPEGSASLLVTEWHKVQEGRVTSTCMMFDTGSDAVALMRDALARTNRPDKRVK